MAVSGRHGLHAVPGDGWERPVETLAATTEGTEIRRLGRNEVLFDQGHTAKELYIVQRGRVALFYRAADGRESLVSLHSDGDLIGLVGLFDGGEYPAQARALEDATVVVVPYGPVRRVLDREPALMWSLGRVLSGRLRNVGCALADTVFLDLTARTAKKIVELAGAADDFQLPVTQEELAAMVGASRERVNKAIATFIRLGWLDQRGRHYRIRNREALERRARG